MTNSAPSRDSVQRARKTARGRPLSSSLKIIDSALSESPLPKRRKIDNIENNVGKEDAHAASKTVPRSRNAERTSTQCPFLPPSVLSVRVSPDPTLSSGACKGEVDDDCYRSIVELFAKRYIQTFDKDRLALINAYTSEATFSCRFISSSSSPLPYHFAKCNTGTLQGPSDIVQVLSSFSWRIVLVPPVEITLDVTIDVLRLTDMNYFVTLIFDTIIDGVGVSVDMVFLLKDNTRLTGKQDLSRVLWTPFVVMSHQIILRS